MKNSESQIEKKSTAKKLDLSNAVKNFKKLVSAKNTKQIYIINSNFLSSADIEKICKEFNCKDTDLHTLNYLAVNKIFQSEMKNYRQRLRKEKNSYCELISKDLSIKNVSQFLAFYTMTFLVNDLSIESFTNSNDNKENYIVLLKSVKSLLDKQNLTF